MKFYICYEDKRPSEILGMIQHYDPEGVFAKGFISFYKLGETEND